MVQPQGNEKKRLETAVASPNNLVGSLRNCHRMAQTRAVPLLRFEESQVPSGAFQFLSTSHVVLAEYG